MMTEDFDAFFDTDELGDAMTYSGQTIAGQYTREFVEVNGVEGFYPTFLSTTTALAGISIGGTVTVGGASMSVVAKRFADETGKLSRLILNEV
jgi:hypothetical protein